MVYSESDVNMGSRALVLAIGGPLFEQVNLPDLQFEKGTVFPWGSDKFLAKLVDLYSSTVRVLQSYNLTTMKVYAALAHLGMNSSKYMI